MNASMKRRVCRWRSKRWRPWAWNLKKGRHHLGRGSLHRTSGSKQVLLDVLRVFGKVWKGFPEESGICSVVVEKAVVSRGDGTASESTPT